MIEQQETELEKLRWGAQVGNAEIERLRNEIYRVNRDVQRVNSHNEERITEIQRLRNEILRVNSDVERVNSHGEEMTNERNKLEENLRLATSIVIPKYYDEDHQDNCLCFNVTQSILHAVHQRENINFAHLRTHMPRNLPVPKWLADNHPGREPCYQRKVFGDCRMCNSKSCTAVHVEAGILDNDFLERFCVMVSDATRCVTEPRRRELEAAAAARRNRGGRGQGRRQGRGQGRRR